MLWAIVMVKYGYFWMSILTILFWMKMSNKYIATFSIVSYKINSLLPLSMLNLKNISDDLYGIKWSYKLLGYKSLVFFVGGYNVLTNADGNFWGVPYNIRKSMNFIAIIQACGIIDIRFRCKKFSWSKKRGVNYSICKRLYRALINDKCPKPQPLIYPLITQIIVTC